MSFPIVAVNRNLVELSFREWQQEQSLLDAQLAESVAALDAYQANLDNWQQELIRERDELRKLRETLAGEEIATDAQLLDQLHQELSGAREQITSLRSREEELLTELAALKEAAHAERQHWEKQISHQHDLIGKAVEHAATNHHGDSVRNSPVKSEPRRAASPVLGSVMEQFGKLREQRSMNRPNPKPR